MKIWVTTAICFLLASGWLPERMRLRCGLARAQATTVDPNATAATKAELALLYSLISASSGHVFQSHQQVERQCGGSCSNSPAPGILPGGIGTGYCNGSWGDPNTPMCVFGSGSDTNIQAKAAWAKGELVQMDMHFPNPFDNYQNQPSGGVMANACSGRTVLKGLSGDCSGVSDVTLNNMITTGAAANANWNSLLDQFVGGLQDLQNSGVVVILRPFHEINGNWFWWSSAGEPTKQALFRYVQNYFNNVKGLHNILWEYCIVDDPGTLVGYPGDQFVDLMATDVYFQVSGPTGGYTRLATHNKPIAFAENNCGGTAAVCFNSCNWDNQLQDAKANMPLVVWMNYWWDGNPGLPTSSAWTAYLRDPYSRLAGSSPPPQASQPSLGRD